MWYCVTLDIMAQQHTDIYGVMTQSLLEKIDIFKLQLLKQYHGISSSILL